MSIPATLTRFNFEQPTSLKANTAFGQVAASTVIKRGDLLKYDASGNLVQAIALPTTTGYAITNNGQLLLAGIAGEDITTNSAGYSNIPAEAALLRNSIQFSLLTEEDLLLLRVVSIAGAITDGTEFLPVAAESTQGTLPLVQGTAYKLCRVKVSSTDGFYGVTKNTTAPDFVYMGLVPTQLSTSQYTAVRGIVPAAARKGLI